MAELLPARATGGDAGFFDPVAIANVLITRAVSGLDKTLDYTEARAKKHAPVRQIFRRDRRGPEFDRLAVTSASPNPANVNSMYRRRPMATQEQFDRWKRSRAPQRQITYADPNRIGQGPFTRQRGNANSEVPVFRVGKRTLSGDFRQTEGERGSGRLVPVQYAYQSQGGIGKVVEAGSVSAAEGFNIMRGGKKKRVTMLTSRGRYEVRSKRADWHGRTGGRLKNSIERQGPTRKGAIYWGYVGTDVPYAGFQEYGTSHHRAHPFLRPALYESRRVFIQNVKAALRRRDVGNSLRREVR